MTDTPRPALLARFLPEGPILLALIALLHWVPRSTLAGFAAFYAYAVGATGLWIGIRYRRSRLVLALLALAIATAALQRFTTGVPPLTARVVFQACALLLPLNLAALSFLDERGVLTEPGLYTIAAMLGQAAVVGALLHGVAAPVASSLELHLLPVRLMAWSHVGDPALLGFATALVALLLGPVVVPNPSARAFAGAVIAVFIGLAVTRQGPGSLIAFGTAGLMLVLAVIEASHVMAYQDGLTGLPGRRAFAEALLRLGGQYSVAMVDVDHFKRFNDTYGHDVGDQVLKMVAARLGGVGGGGASYRYGGEEFAVLFPGKAAAQAEPAMEEVRQRIERSTFTVRGRVRPRARPDKPPPPPRAAKRVRQKLSVTVSVGIADADAGATADKVVIAADRALYKAKEAGRNRVVS